METSYSWDDYFIPGTFVLRNKFTGPGKPYGEPDGSVLMILEEAATALRLRELFEDPVVGRFDYDHMKAVHYHIFQDVYEWAGQERTAPTEGPMFKAGHAYYRAGPQLATAAEAEYAKIAASGYLQGLGREAFVIELTERWGELNVVHSFREGNTRSQFAFFSQLCTQAGYELNPDAFRPGNPLREQFIQARFHSQDTGRNDQLATVLAKGITHLPPSRTVAAPKAEETDDASRLRVVSFPVASAKPGDVRGRVAAGLHDHRPSWGVRRDPGRDKGLGR